MRGLSYVLILLFSAALPLFLAAFWMYRKERSFFPLPFATALLSGMLSLFPALLLQQPFLSLRGNTLLFLLFRVFIGIALTEECGRLVGLGLLHKVAPKLERFRQKSPGAQPFYYAPFSGLSAGLGFAMLESASYALNDPSIALLRAFSAAPLHAACGIRVALALDAIKKEPVKAIFLFVSSVFIHGMYNLFILVPVFPSFFPVVLAFIALFSALASLRSKNYSPDA